MPCIQQNSHNIRRNHAEQPRQRLLAGKEAQANGLQYGGGKAANQQNPIRNTLHSAICSSANTANADAKCKQKNIRQRHHVPSF
ncbi:hypothetical protein [Butyricicoccus sp.]|uniref:hypothetical protein n=1 Tax=Butyricicoccus sp. TaxID=2049021 RepID=UPI003AF9CD12